MFKELFSNLLPSWLWQLVTVVIGQATVATAFASSALVALLLTWLVVKKRPGLFEDHKRQRDKFKVWTLASVLFAVSSIIFLQCVSVGRATDYAYGLSYTGVSAGQNSADQTFQFMVHLTNAAPVPIRYKVTYYRIILGEKTLHLSPDFIKSQKEKFVIPIGQQTSFPYPAFTLDQLKDYQNANSSGTVEIDILYWPYYGGLRRQLSIRSPFVMSWFGQQVVAGGSMSGVKDEVYFGGDDED